MARTTTVDPARTERWTVMALSGVGALVFLICAGLSGWALWHKMRLSETHRPVTVTVEAADTLCEVQRRSGKTWVVDSVHACTDAIKVVAERGDGLTRWRSVEVSYAAVAYAVDGAPQQKLIRVVELSAAPVKAGDEVAMYANPASPGDIERPIRDEDYATFVTLSALGAGLGVFVALLGKWLAGLNRKKQEAALAAGGTVNPNGTVSFSNTASDGTSVAFEVALWAKIVSVFGTVVLFAGIALAAVGIFGSLTSGESNQALSGSLIIAAIALVVWRASRLFADLGVTARRK